MILQVIGQRLNVLGSVATCYPAPGNGIEFTEIEPEDQITCRSLLQCVSCNESRCHLAHPTAWPLTNAPEQDTLRRNYVDASALLREVARLP